MKNKLRKKVLLGLCIIIAISFPFDFVYAEEKSANVYALEGSGTESSPYLIYDEYDMSLFHDLAESDKLDDGTWFSLVRDVTIHEWEPIGSYENDVPFNGVLDGCGHTITIEGCRSRNSALFEVLNGEVRNLVIEGIFDGEDNASSVANYGNGTVLNCLSYASVSSGGDNGNAAGIVNHWNGEIINACFLGQIHGVNCYGIANNASNDKIENVYAEGKKAPGLKSGFKNQTLEEVAEAFNTKLKESPYDASASKCMLWEISNGILRLSNGCVGFEGAGMENNPYIIRDDYDLLLLADYVNDGADFSGCYFAQVGDISIDSTSWPEIARIASEGEGQSVFRGTYNGCGYKIVFKRTEQVSLFGVMYGCVLNVDVSSETPVENNVLLKSLGDGEGYVYNSRVRSSQDIDSAFHRGVEKLQIINCYIDGFGDLTEEMLNDNLPQLVKKYGIHCGNLYQWGTDEVGLPVLGKNYQDTYLSAGISHWIGKGTEQNPYLVENLDDLIYLREDIYYNHAYDFRNFLQTTDIDLSEVLDHWIPISAPVDRVWFHGIYNGDGHRIIATIGDREKMTVASVFGNMDGTLQNVVLEIDGVEAMTEGILVNYNRGKILNSIVIVPRIHGKTTSVLCKYNEGRIENSVLVVGKNDAYARVTDVNDGTVQHTKVVPYEDAGGVDIDLLNYDVIRTAYDSKRGVRTLNTWKVLDGVPLPVTNISRFSSYWFQNLFYIFCKTKMLWFAATWLVFLLVIYAYRLRKGSFKFLPEKSWYIELIPITLLITLFLPALACLTGMALSRKLMLVELASAIVFALCFARLCKKGRISNIKTIVTSHWKLLLALAVPAIVVVSHFDIDPCYDSDLYYGDFIYGLDNFDGTLAGLVPTFVSWGKGSHIHSMLWTIGELFSRGTGRGVYAANLLLLWISQICVFLILKKVFPNLSDSESSALTAIYGLMPYVCAGVVYINPDTCALFFFTIAVCCYLYNRKILEVFSIYALAEAKINMILLYAVFLACMMLVEYRKNIKKVLLNYPIGMRTFAIVVYLCVNYFVYKYNGHGSAPRSYYYDSSMKHVLVLHGESIGTRILQYCGYGFWWMVEILFFVVLLRTLLRKKRIQGDVGFVVTMITCGLSVLAVMIYNYYLTLCPRYFAVAALKSAVLLAFVISNTERKMSRRIVLLLLLAVFLVQEYITVDPLVLATTKKGVLGSNCLEIEVIQNSGFYGDSAFYSFSYGEAATDAAYAYKQVGGDTAVYTEGRWADGYSLGLTNSGIYPVYYDVHNGKKTYRENENTSAISVCEMAGKIYGYQKYKMLEEAKLTLLVSDYEKSWLVDWLMLNGYQVDRTKSGKDFDVLVATRIDDAGRQ